MRYEDSRHAWVVAVSGCLLLFIVLGVNRINGLLFVSLMEKEELNRGLASWPFNLPGAAVIIISPIGGLLSARYSPTSLALVGMILFFLSHIPCYFSTDIVVMSVFYGLLRGCGVGLVALIVPLVTGTSFKRHRATAMGLSTSGQAMAGILLPPLIQFFLFQFGLNGTILLLGGISAHGFLGCLGYMWYRGHSKSKAVHKVPTKEKGEHSPLLKETSEQTTYGCAEKRSSMDAASNVEHGEAGAKHDVKSDGHHEEVSSAKDVADNPDNKSSPTGKGTPQNAKMSWSTFRKLMCNKSFYMVSANQIVIVFLGQILTQVVIDYMADKGIESTLALYMLTSNSVGEIAGRLCLGWIPDKKLLSNENYLALCLALAAGMTALISYSVSFPVLMVTIFIFGASQGSTLSMNFVHFADRMSKAELALALAFTRSLNGVSALARAPVIGSFRDILGSYDLLFYMLSGVVLFMAFAWIVEGCVNSRKTKKAHA